MSWHIVRSSSVKRFTQVHPFGPGHGGVPGSCATPGPAQHLACPTRSNPQFEYQRDFDRLSNYTAHRRIPRRPRARLRRDRPAFVYDGRDLYARIVLQADGWHAVLEASGAVLGPFPTCASAILFCNARKAHTPAAPIAGERAADANHVKKIQTRQRQAREQRARRVGSDR